ncbi:phytoene desaturase family protein [Luedemannella flava]|uniref:Phytoene desaturase family protein n=1 Tax=Luedemannella flava TaxID=349316 RepID=A0ABP4XTA2_9ACTN
MQGMRGRTDRIVIIGAGLGGLACAIHLAAAGRQVVVLESTGRPGGLAGRLSIGGFEFDTGPSAITAPEILAETFAAVGENLADWLDLVPLDPTVRAHFPDGSTLDVIPDRDRMADEVRRVCGGREARAYLNYAAYAENVWGTLRRRLRDRSPSSPAELLRPALLGEALRLAAGGVRHGLEHRIGQFFTDPRCRRLFAVQSLLAGVAPHQAPALFTALPFLDPCGKVFFPRGGVHAMPAALAGAAQKHGVTIRYDTAAARLETHAGRARAVHTVEGERIPADVVVLPPVLAESDGELRPAAPAGGSGRASSSCVLVHLGSRQRYGRIAHHNLHFGRGWREPLADVARHRRPMRDPVLLVANPTRTDPELAPRDREIYQIMVPAPSEADAAAAARWRTGLAQRYAGELIATLEARGYLDLGQHIDLAHVVTPADWASPGHRPLRRTSTGGRGPDGHPSGGRRGSGPRVEASNIVFVGSGTRPGVGVPMVLMSGRHAAARITGARP